MCSSDLFPSHDSLSGYEAAEALQLPELMLAYKTVNLLKLPNAVKKTAPCGIQFTHVLAWLFGLFRDQHNIHEMLNFRSILKNLTTKGLQMGDVTGDDQVYTDLWLEEDENDRKVPLLTFEEVRQCGQTVPCQFHYPTYWNRPDQDVSKSEV